MSAFSTAPAPVRRPTPVEPRDAVGAALDDALARLVPALAAPAEHLAALRAALLSLLAAVDRHDPLPLAAAEGALAPLELAARDGAASDPALAALAALRALLDRAWRLDD